MNWKIHDKMNYTHSHLLYWWKCNTVIFNANIYRGSIVSPTWKFSEFSTEHTPSLPQPGLYHFFPNYKGFNWNLWIVSQHSYIVFKYILIFFNKWYPPNNSEVDCLLSPFSRWKLKLRLLNTLLNSNIEDNLYLI